MPHDTSHPLPRSLSPIGLSGAWQRALALLALGALAVLTVSAREWAEMAHQWWNIDTYSHILLVPVIIGWLIALKAKEMAAMAPRAWAPGLLIFAGGFTLWAIGRGTELNIIAHAGAVGALQGAVISVLGPRISLVLALPISFGVFLVPIGDEFIPALQMITADIAVALTRWSGIRAVVDGIYIDTPVGLFIVAEACSGVRFLIAMATLAVLVCFTRFNSWWRRAVFMAAAVIVPIIANGIRAWGTIYVAQSHGVEFASGFDHIVYGWFFFAIVVAILLGAAWRYFERDPQSYGWSAREVDRFAFLHRIEAASTSSIVVIAGFFGIAIVAAMAPAIVAPHALG